MTALPVLPGGNNANVFWMNNLGQFERIFRERRSPIRAVPSGRPFSYAAFNR